MHRSRIMSSAMLLVGILVILAGSAQSFVFHSSPFVKKGARSNACLSLRSAVDSDQKWRGPGNPYKKIEVRKPTWGDDLIDDLTSKRFGNGWAFYGERETLKDKNYEEIGAQLQEAANFRPERPDSVLVIGATGQVGGWVTLKIAAGMNTRILARNFDKAEDLFGRDGKNMDIYLGDVKKMDDVDNACEDAKAVVFCAGGSLPFGPNSYESVDVGGMKNLLEVVKRYPTIKRVIMISSAGEYGLGALKTKLEAEELLRAQSHVRYAIVRVPKILPLPGGTYGVRIQQGDTKDETQGITLGDIGDVVVSLLLMDDVAAKAEAAKSEAKIPRVPDRVTMTLCNDEAKLAPEDALSSLVMSIGSLRADN